MAHPAPEDRQDQIIQLLRQRNEEGVRLLFKHYGGALATVIRRIVPEQEVVDEILHDVIIRIWQNFGKYDDDKSRLYTWMARVARNAAIDRSRSKNYRKAGKTTSLDDLVVNPKRSTVNPSVDHIGVAKLLTGLDPKHRAVIELLYLKDYTQAETAEELALPLGTVKTRARRALQKLREILRHELILLLLLFFI